MNESKILAVRDEKAAIAEPIMGIPLEYIPFAEVNAAWQAADSNEARSVVEKWLIHSDKVTDVSWKELRNSAAMYLGMKSVLKNHQANAITMNCLGGFYGNHIHAYPCLGFFELNNEGLIGACECDINSTATMVAFNTMTQGRPGMISDPVIDTSKRQIIYAHCVAPNKVFGPDGPSNPFTIMTHSEDRQGAAVRSILPPGYMTTTLKIDDKRKEIIFHQARTVDNDPDDRACRTKLCAEPVGDMEKLFTEWDQWGWHRVTFYGDLKKQTYDLADSMGWKVVEET
jgi:L-fucose isomerase-like protein